MRGRFARGALAAVTATAAGFGATAALAQDPAAIVEDASQSVTQVQFMDYLPAGRVVRLESGQELTLGYIRSCWREVIRGGVVTVGAEQSVVAGGQVRRQKVECDGGRMRLTAEQAGQSGVMVFRRPPLPPAGAGPAEAALKPRLTLHGRSPLVEMQGGGRLVIERLDRPGERQEIDVAPAPGQSGPGQTPPGQAQRAAHYDFARAGRALEAGGLYRASAPLGEIVFRVDPAAPAGATPIIGRLLRF